jgi:ferredoxin
MGAVAFLGCLKRHGVLTAEPPQLPPLTAGAAVLAVLDEDGMWHDAVVLETKSGGAGGPPRVLVRFVEWSKVQEMARVDVVSLAAVIDDDDANEARDGDCELCGRCLELTFHHLIPKETHARYLGKGLPRGVAEASVARGMDNPQPTREFLHSYGVMLCRYCHSAVHRFAPNAVLAQRFSTLEGLASAPEIARFVAFAAKQKVTSRK